MDATQIGLRTACAKVPQPMDAKMTITPAHEPDTVPSSDRDITEDSTMGTDINEVVTANNTESSTGMIPTTTLSMMTGMVNPNSSTGIIPPTKILTAQQEFDLMVAAKNLAAALPKSADPSFSSTIIPENDEEEDDRLFDDWWDNPRNRKRERTSNDH
jgi:hypothetical protein